MLTVLMATHNGSATLSRVLESYTQLIAPAGGWRVVVVDNNSTDSTSEILNTYSDKLPLLALYTDKRGKNLALNLGLSHVEGDLVVLTDDDALADPAWLSTIRNVVDTQTDFDIFGGMILPVWPEGLPDWIPRLVNLGATYAISPPGMQTGPVLAAQIWGPNMAIRAKIFQQGHRFNEGVGPQAGQYMMGSEVEFTCRLEKAGHKAWFTAEAVVGHVIRPNQIDRQWIVQRAYRLGRHMFHQERESWPPETSFFRGAPRWKYRQLVSSRLGSMLGAVVGNFDKKFLADWDISFLQGYLKEAKDSLGQ